MATQFRSKGKGRERKVYPIAKKRSPYGINRELAAKDVQKLREDGKKARLIETNTRLGLYAPFVSTLTNVGSAAPSIPQSTATSPNQVEAPPVPENITPPTPENRNFMVSKDKADAILTSIGILNDKGNLNELKKNYNHWFRDGIVKINVQDGKAELTALDSDIVAAIQERFFVDIPDGLYTIKQAHDGTPKIVPVDDYDSKTANLKFPMMDYDKNAAVLSIPDAKVKEFVSIFNESAKDSEIIKFRSINGKDGMDIIKRTTDGDYNKTETVVYHYDGTAIPDNISCTVSREYLASTIDTMFGRSRVNNPKGINDFNLKIKSDYPVEIQFTGQDKRGESTGYRGLLAPRME